MRRLLRGPDTNPRWARPALLGLLALTAFLYLIDLSRNGWANDFYSAAVISGTKSWKAFFFGSFDAANFITVDKTPASLWVMEISGRIFGVNSWSMLVPQALEGVASVGVLYAAVRRWFGPATGLIAGLTLALTPVAALMFRFNNPDALLVLLLTIAAYAMVRALENGRSRWLVLCGVLIGFAFLSKMLQAFLVVPGFALVYLWAGPPRLGQRIRQVVWAGLGIVAGAGWWIAIAELVPAADRPYFGGSTDNNILQLAIGYNGLGRLDGSETGSIGGGGNAGGSAFGGSTGITRLFGSEFGGQISWLLPAALIALVAMLWVSRRAVRTDRTRAAALLWGGWLVVTALTFSYMSGIIHPYYMVALAPAIAALVAIGAMALGRQTPWERTLGWLGRIVCAAAVAVTGGWAFVLLNRDPSWYPWLRWLIIVFAVLAVLAIVGQPRLMALGRTRRGRLGLAGLPIALVMLAGLSGPAAYAAETVASTHTGSIPSAGPASAGGFGGGGGGGGGRPGGGGFTGQARGATSTGSTGSTGGSAKAGGAGGFTGKPPSGMGTGGTGTGTGTGKTGTGSRTGGFPGGTSSRTGAGGVSMGGLSGESSVNKTLLKLLENGASGYKWVAATVGSQEAAPIELATGGDAVLAIGGFNGTDPTPTLAQFKAMVAKGEIHYYLGANGESFGGGGKSNTILSWVEAHYKKETVGGTTVYDLTQAKSS
jgi:4-amino-4-deoxy-L-arabinose transferase-like glycosyltransferase